MPCSMLLEYEVLEKGVCSLARNKCGYMLEPRDVL
jgi:hypothetical protein